MLCNFLAMFNFFTFNVFVGCKIKALRAKTNTYIKTPVRGEEPVFVVTGRKEDVLVAKRDIMAAADHFSQIRASRRNNSVSGGSPSMPTGMGPPSPQTPGQITIQVRVPYRVVGLVVGPKGATIKRIQQQTHTYIVTPSRDKEPVFEVTGLQDNVEKARIEIESHIAMRTGGVVDQSPTLDSDFHTNGVDVGVHDNLLSSMYKGPSSGSMLSPFSAAINSNNALSASQDANVFMFPPVSTAPKSDYIHNGISQNGFGIYDSDEGIAASPGFDVTSSFLANSVWADPITGNANIPLQGDSATTSNSTQRRSLSFGDAPQRLSPTLIDANGADHASLRRICSDPISNSLNGISAFSIPGQTINRSVNGSTSSSPTDSTGSGALAAAHSLTSLNQKQCFVCKDNDVVAALVPCGHNLFCMECANLIIGKTDRDRHCPVCQLPTSQAIRIFS